MESEKRKRGSNAAMVIPLMVAVAAVARVAGRVRTVDFLWIFSAGMLVGVVLTRLMSLVFDKKKTAA